MNSRKELLQVRELETTFFTDDGAIPAVDHISFSLKEGEILGIVGESGCGKSVTSLSIMGLVPSPPGKITSGEILLDGKDLTKLSQKEMRKIRGQEIAMIFQEPMTSLNPLFTIGNQLTEAILIHHKSWSKKKASARAVEMMKLVGLPRAEELLKEYPHQLSGGMRQRVMIAMALVCDPKILIADEPTTALDVTIQAQILELMKEIQKKSNTSIIFITHDLGVVANVADRVAVMYAGQIVEYGTVEDIFYNPKHPYTWGLLGSMPDLNNSTDELLMAIPGSPPNLIDPPKGDAFAPRNEFAMKIDFEMEPPMFQVSETHFAKTWLLHPDAPKMPLPDAVARRIDGYQQEGK